MTFQGVLTAIVTPFHDRGVDLDALKRLVDRQIEAGISGLVPCGTTGEAPTLSVEEHQEESLHLFLERGERPMNTMK